MDTKRKGRGGKARKTILSHTSGQRLGSGAGGQQHFQSTRPSLRRRDSARLTTALIKYGNIINPLEFIRLELQMKTALASFS